jgi:hypothetical protein
MTEHLMPNNAMDAIRTDDNVPSVGGSILALNSGSVVVVVNP